MTAVGRGRDLLSREGPAETRHRRERCQAHGAEPWAGAFHSQEPGRVRSSGHARRKRAAAGLTTACKARERLPLARRGDITMGRANVAALRVTNAAERPSLYQEITDKIIAELEQGRVPWVQPWGRPGVKAGLGLPRNAATGRRYSGVNTLILWGAVIEKGFASQSWLTFRQALS